MVYRTHINSPSDTQMPNEEENMSEANRPDVDSVLHEEKRQDGEKNMDGQMDPAAGLHPDEENKNSIKKSLRIKIFRMNIQLVIAAVLFFAIFGIFQMRRVANLMEETNRTQNAVIADTMSDAMRNMATESFQKYVVSQATVLNGEFWTMRHDMEVLARQVRMVMEDPDYYSPVPVALPSEAVPGELSLQLLYAEDADQEDPELNEQIGRIGGLRNMILEIVEGSDTLLDAVVSLPGGASIIADRTPETKVGEDGQCLFFNAERRPWYVGAEVYQDTYFSPVNMDNYGEFYEVTTGVPVYVDGKLAAVCGCSVRLDSLEKIIAETQIGGATNTCLINENGNVIYSSRQDGELGMVGNELKSLKESTNAELVELVNEALGGGSGFSLLNIDGEETYIAYAPIQTVGWTQLLTVSQEDLNATAYLLMQQTDEVMEETIAQTNNYSRSANYANVSIAMFLIILAVITSLVFADRLVKPIKRMTMRVSEMQGDDMTFQIEDIYMTEDEIEVLARAFSNMSEKMRGYVREIVNITAEKQRLDTELSVASDIQVNMLPNHFPAFPDRHDFDLYAVMTPAKEVGGDFYDFFLIDDDHLGLVMADVSGKGVPAALFMVISKTLIKNIALSGKHKNPGDILYDVNNRLCEGNEDDMFVTVWLGILTISTGDLVSACGGHEYPVFYSKKEGFHMERDPHSLALGAMGGVRFREANWHMDPGDMLFLYTDGVPEATNGAEELFGNDRMLEALTLSWKELSGTAQGIAPEDAPGEPGQAPKETEEKNKAGNTGKGADTSTGTAADSNIDTYVGSDTGTDTGIEPELEAFLRGIRRRIDEYVGDAPQFDDLTMMCIAYQGPEDEQ